MKADLLRKIRALAENGERGESENATSILKALMEKHGISELDLMSDDKDQREFRFVQSRLFDEKLICQIAYQVTGCKDVYVRHRGGKAVKGLIIVECTYEQLVEIEAKYDFYSARLREDMEIFYSAFIQKNRIFHDGSSSDRPLTDEDLKILALADRLDQHSFHKQLK